MGRVLSTRWLNQKVCRKFFDELTGCTTITDSLTCPKHICACRRASACSGRCGHTCACRRASACSGRCGHTCACIFQETRRDETMRYLPGRPANVCSWMNIETATVQLPVDQTFSNKLFTTPCSVPRRRKGTKMVLARRREVYWNKICQSFSLITGKRAARQKQGTAQLEDTCGRFFNDVEPTVVQSQTTKQGSYAGTTDVHGGSATNFGWARNAARTHCGCEPRPTLLQSLGKF